MSNQKSNKLLEDARLLLPWYLTGTLSKEEQAIVNRALEMFPELRKECALEEKMMRTVCDNTSLLELSAMDTTEQRLNKLLARIDKEAAEEVVKPDRVDVKPTSTPKQRLQQWWQHFWHGTGQGWFTPANAVFASLVALQVALLGLYWGQTPKTETVYSVANIEEAEFDSSKKALFLVEFKPDATYEQVNMLLETWQARVVTGPVGDTKSFYIIELPTKAQTSPQQLADEIWNRAITDNQPVSLSVLNLEIRRWLTQMWYKTVK